MQAKESQETSARCIACDGTGRQFKASGDPKHPIDGTVECAMCNGTGKCVFPASTEQAGKQHSVINFAAWTTIDKWLRENPKATAAECLTELVKRIKIEAAPATPVAQPEVRYMYEDQLPADMPKEDYDKWYAQSFVPNGIGFRVGPAYPFTKRF
jgi:hypothetical protein